MCKYNSQAQHDLKADQTTPRFRGYAMAKVTKKVQHFKRQCTGENAHLYTKERFEEYIKQEVLQPNGPVFRDCEMALLYKDCDENTKYDDITVDTSQKEVIYIKGHTYQIGSTEDGRSTIQKYHHY